MNKFVKQVTQKELLSIPLVENGEELKLVNFYDNKIKFGYEGFEKPKGMSDDIIIRNTVAKKLAHINSKLNNKNPNLVLNVCYGYRPPEIQRAYFEKIKKEIISSDEIFLNEDELNEEVHKYIAVPKTAGHPAGAAVDLTIYDTKLKSNLDMGSLIDDFSDKDKMSWLAEDLSDAQAKNRAMLLELMLAEDFAPFWGEWWHYSFGDSEWAAYYDEPVSIYGEVQYLNL